MWTIKLILKKNQTIKKLRLEIERIRTRVSNLWILDHCLILEQVFNEISVATSLVKWDNSWLSETCLRYLKIYKIVRIRFSMRSFTLLKLFFEITIVVIICSKSYIQLCMFFLHWKKNCFDMDTDMCVCLI